MKYGEPLALRLDLDHVAVAQITMLRDELAGERPTKLLAVWDAYAAVGDDQKIRLLALALIPLVRELRDKPRQLERFRIGGNLEREQRALAEVAKRLDATREPAAPPAYAEALAAYERLLSVYASVFGKPVDGLRKGPAEVDPNWLRRAASVDAPR